MRRPGAPPFKAGLIALVVIAVGTYFAFVKAVPFQSHYEISAVFHTANNVKERQPVRIAGVDVGKVVEVEHERPGREAAVIKMRINDGARPIHDNARVTIRPRLFLEGNWFLELEPGTPEAGELEDGGVIPIQQTRTPVQLGQVLTALQADTRKNLQTLLAEYASALEDQGAAGYRRSIRWWEPAYKNSAIVQEATRGLREHDLSDYIDSAGRVARGLDRHPEQLKSLITDFNTAAAAFAREAGSLEAAIAELPRTLRAGTPALAALNRSLPALRRLSRDLRPSVRESNETIDVSFPFLRQLRRLVSRAELRGLVRDLRPTVPSLARLTRRSRGLFEQLRLASGCENEVLEEWSNDRLEDPNFPATGPVFEEAPKPLPGLSGESRSGDANGQWVHVLVSAGDRTVSAGDGRFAQALLPILGTNPPKPDGFPPLRPDVPCETQEPPDLRTRTGPGERQVARGLPNTPKARARYERAKRVAVRWLRRQLRREGLADEFRVRLKEATSQELLGGGDR
jgi:phospholipid/cholesterol/gamma-HCH transport system substrate-binding protein